MKDSPTASSPSLRQSVALCHARGSRNQRLWLSCIRSVSVAFTLLVGLACDATSSAPESMSPSPTLPSRQPLLASPLLNEISTDPPGTDGPWEFVELVGAPSGSLESVSLWIVDGDVEKNPGGIDFSVDFDTACGENSCLLGANGLLLLRNAAGHLPLDLATAVLAGLPQAKLPNGSLSALLVSCAATLARVDLDPQNSCVLDLPEGCTLLDGISWTDGDPGDCAYTALVGTMDTSAASRRAACTEKMDATQWFAGNLRGEPDSLQYAGDVIAALTPGAPNPRQDSDLSNILAAGSSGTRDCSSGLITNGAAGSSSTSASPSSAPQPALTGEIEAAGTAGRAQTTESDVLGTAQLAGGILGWGDSLVGEDASAAGTAVDSPTRLAPTTRPAPDGSCQCAALSPPVGRISLPLSAGLLSLLVRFQAGYCRRRGRTSLPPRPPRSANPPKPAPLRRIGTARAFEACQR